MPGVTLVNTMTNEVLDVEGVQRKFGVPPERIVDYLTLIGDTVDNVPGVPKVGPKTAVKWLTEHGTLQNIVQHADAIGGVVGENLRKAVDWLPTGRQLLKIRTDCDLSAYVPELPSLETIRLAEPHESELLAFYEKFGFKKLNGPLGNTGHLSGVWMIKEL